MRFCEAMQLLEEGKKVRKTCWSDDGYIYKNKEGYIVDEFGDSVDSQLYTADGEWKEYTGNANIEKTFYFPFYKFTYF